jgi:hypothetical protein
MNILSRHELFEIEVLDKLKNAKLLERLIFGGGTMLRLCHEMKRFSADLDFWKMTKVPDEDLFLQIQNLLRQNYDITDAQIKYFTILIEIRSSRFPKKLKVEIRREQRDWDFEDKIAYSVFDTRQVLVKAHTLKQSMDNKISALLDRSEIRDAFDIEFILHQGVPLPKLSQSQKHALLHQLDRFKPRDYKVTLGSLLEKDIRNYYVEQRFHFFRRKIETL